ncbi:MnmC family methyltransferase [Bacteroidetes bacterium endosymbiont of Geopemphigus sp.]|uniref:MnmC family methyltransferase n=1 Tax=Bacteroidetes bacterium endosymbiont of Geopemphigus sp. TaxID=2047937 RepID=UPI000CD31345|nr:MnmC family methyltransferase [Bacteroidetes bacterium endosymbiont of Geopemphigus sp.]
MLNHLYLLKAESYPDSYEKLFTSPWETSIPIFGGFSLTKMKQDLHNFHSERRFDIIYFYAFIPNIQADLWSIAFIKKLYGMTANGGLLLTYYSKGDVRRNLQAAGFIINKTTTGPPEKEKPHKLLNLIKYDRTIQCKSIRNSKGIGKDSIA